MLEKMGAFFDARLEEYDEHQLTCIEGAQEFYPFSAACLPAEEQVEVLDLGCGTGLELIYYFKHNPTARVTGIDLAPGMLSRLRERLSDYSVTTVNASYFEAPFGTDSFDVAISVESLHHFTKEEKIPLYQKLWGALRSGGYFILTDYFAASDEEERAHRATLEHLKAEQGLLDAELYHYDTPLTVAHEIEALSAAGFSKIEILGRWGATYTIKALKC